MSKYLSKKYAGLTPYVPGEQPKEKLIKLNTNESPFPPSPLAQRLARQAAGDLRLYSDPECTALKEAAAEYFGVQKENLIFSNGSDEILQFAFAAFCDASTPAKFADVTYGFYPVFAESLGIAYEEIPLKNDFTIDPADYYDAKATIFIANPNAQTGILLPVNEIEKIVARNPENVVVIDEAYVDFGGESAVPLTKKYENLLVVGTFSKSRSLAGARLGYAIGDKSLIADLNMLKYSFNPFNVNAMTAAAGVGALLDDEYFKKNCRTIIDNRAYLTDELKMLGFEVLPSSANFLLCKHPEKSGVELFKGLRSKGVLVRRFDINRINEYLRITIGSYDELKTLVEALRELL